MGKFAPYVLLVPVALAAGCDSGLGTAVIENRVDTVLIGALVGTPISVPSAYGISPGVAGPVRTDQTSQFDFAYNILPDGRRVLLPRAALGLTSPSAEPGLQASEDGFDAINEAPLNGYLTLDTIEVAVGHRYIVRSRVACTSIGVPLYGKIEILAVDDVDRRLTFRALANTNCGFRSLQPGLPED
ncbi:MAG: hypothetical protein ACREOF_05680 [Gemmatimonadales bacterium]